MAIAPLLRHVLTMAVLGLAFITGTAGCGGASSPPARAQERPPTSPSLVYNHTITDDARLLAGMQPEDGAHFAKVLGRESWKTHKKELDAAYKQPSAVRDLPFSFGYHWRNGTSSVMLAVRQAATH